MITLNRLFYVSGEVCEGSVGSAHGIKEKKSRLSPIVIVKFVTSLANKTN